jgi:hypothetical protein
MAKGNVGDLVKTVRDKSRRAIDDAEKGGKSNGYIHPATAHYRNKPKATSMAPDSKNKRKSYGREIPETAAEERARKRGS